MSNIKNNGGQSNSRVAPLLIGCLAVITFGLFPSNNMLWAKCFVAEWAVLIMLTVLFFKNNWIKAFVILCLFQFIRTFMIGGAFRILSFNTFYYILLFCIVYQVLLNKVTKFDTLKIVNGLCVIVLIQLGYMYLQYFGIDPLFTLNSKYIGHSGWLSTQNLVTGFWSHTNISGASLAITLPLFWRRKWWVFILPIIAMIVLTQSLGAVIAAGCGLLFCYLFSDFKVSAKIGISLIILGSIIFYGNTVDKRQFSLKNDRIAMLTPTVDIIKKHPVIGYGLGQYKVAFPQISNHVFKRTDNDVFRQSNAHFDFVECVFDIGILGGILIIGFFTGLFLYFRRNKTLLSLLAFSGLVAGLVNSCSTFIFHTPLAWILLILIVIIQKEEIVNEKNI